MDRIITLTRYHQEISPRAEVLVAVRVLSSESCGEEVKVSYDDLVEEPGADPLLLINWDQTHLIYWSELFWYCDEWQELWGVRAGKFSRFTIPLMKKAYPSLSANQIVNVQPMRLPAALSYYLKHRYAKTRNGT